MQALLAKKLRERKMLTVEIIRITRKGMQVINRKLAKGEIWKMINSGTEKFIFFLLITTLYLNYGNKKRKRAVNY